MRGTKTKSRSTCRCPHRFAESYRNIFTSADLNLKTICSLKPQGKSYTNAVVRTVLSITTEAEAYSKDDKYKDAFCTLKSSVEAKASEEESTEENNIVEYFYNN